MTSEKLKKYLQSYIDNILIGDLADKTKQHLQAKITVVEILKERISPPVIKIYLHFEPEALFDFAGASLDIPFKYSERNLHLFLKAISFTDIVTFIWNKPPNYGWNSGPF